MSSNCRTLNRSSRNAQQSRQPNPGIIRVNQLAHEIISRDPEKIVNHLVILFLEDKKVTAGTTLIKLASGAIVEAVETEQPSRRPGLLSKWIIDLDRQEKEEAAAQEAASRELGQIPEPKIAPEVAVEKVASPAPQPQPAAAHSTTSNTSSSNTSSSNTSNTHTNEIGLPVRTTNPTGQLQTSNASETRPCRTQSRPGAPGHESNQAVLNRSGASIYA